MPTCSLVSPLARQVRREGLLSDERDASSGLPVAPLHCVGLHFIVAGNEI